LMNFCLHPEEILQNEALSSIASELLDCLVPKLDQGSFGSEVMLACFQHSQVADQSHSGDETISKEEGRELLDVLHGTPNLSSKALRGMQDFVTDLSSAFMEYGAQYEIFVRAIRLFLRPSFPATIRCEVLQLLRHVLVLLTIPEEEKDQKLLQATVQEYIAAPGTNESAEVLDAVADIFKKAPRELGLFFTLLSISILANDMIQRSTSGRDVDHSRRRISSCPKHISSAVLEVSSRQKFDHHTVANAAEHVLRGRMMQEVTSKQR